MFLATIAPLVLCQSLYMNASAVPTFHKKIWTSLQYEDPIVRPTLLVFHPLNFINYVQADSSSSPDSCESLMDASPEGNCSKDMQWNVIYANTDYHIFNPSSQQNNITLQPK